MRGTKLGHMHHVGALALSGTAAARLLMKEQDVE